MGMCVSKSGRTTLDSTPADDPLRRQMEAAEAAANKEIQSWISTAERNDYKVKKLLLLGAGSSGKSTLFKQLKCIYNVNNNEGFLQEDYHEATIVIRRNCISGIVILLKKATEFYTEDPEMNEDCCIEIDENSDVPEVTQMVRDIKLCLLYSKEQFTSLPLPDLGGKRRDSMSEEKSYDHSTRSGHDGTGMDTTQHHEESSEDDDNEYLDHVIRKGDELLLEYGNNVEQASPPLDWRILKGLGGAIARLWALDAMKNTFDRRGVYKFSFPDNMDYFFDTAEAIFTKNYIADNEDVLRCRIRTTGMIDYTFPVENKKDMFLNIYDVGGQRSERKKWIHHFENVTAVIFVAALNHYCAVLFEDEKVNAMVESVQLFDEIVNNKWFIKTEIILFLNKDDLFRERLVQGIPLNVCFNDDAPDEPGGWRGAIYEGFNYSDPIPENLISEETREPLTDEEWFIVCYKEALAFIQKQYIIRCSEEMGDRAFTHVTTATNKDNVKKVFWDVQNIVISSNLKRGGLV